MQRRYHVRAFEYVFNDDPKRFFGNWNINNTSFVISLKENKVFGVYKKGDWDSVEFEGEVVGQTLFFTWKEKGYASTKEYKGVLILVNDNKMEGYIEKSIDNIGVTSEILGERIG